ncbi:MAG: hypothetical protein OEY23_08965 [Acidimicrobiia bacterium]|nr:hypothetical protein [Acidimicrobiia bacterium]
MEKREPDGHMPTAETNIDQAEFDDEALLRLLRPYVDQVDGPSPLSYELAYAALELSTLDAELAELTFDSALAADEELLAIRASLSRRFLSFALGDGLALELDVLERRVVGTVAGVQLTGVEWRSGSTAGKLGVVEGDEFVMDPCPEGPFYLLLTMADRRVVTDWLMLY